eukprot:2425992-Rhodomonas_salina.1
MTANQYQSSRRMTENQYRTARRAVIGSLTSLAASFVACAVCPSCHRNSRVRRKGVGFLNSHRTTLHLPPTRRQHRSSTPSRRASEPGIARWKEERMVGRRGERQITFHLRYVSTEHRICDLTSREQWASRRQIGQLDHSVRQR